MQCEENYANISVYKIKSLYTNMERNDTNGRKAKSKRQKEKKKEKEKKNEQHE